MAANFKDLISASGLSQSKAADFISLKAQRMCSERDIRAWVALPGLKNSRPCPEWVMAVMNVFSIQVPQAA